MSMSLAERLTAAAAALRQIDLIVSGPETGSDSTVDLGGGTIVKTVARRLSELGVHIEVVEGADKSILHGQIGGLWRFKGLTATAPLTIVAETGNLRVALDPATLAAMVPAARQVTGSGLATGGGTLDADRVIDVPAASQAEAEAGVENTKGMTALRTKQAIDALPAGGSVPTSRTITTTGLLSGGGDLAANRTFDVPIASQAEAEAGVNNTKGMTALRVAEAIAAQPPGGTVSD